MKRLLPLLALFFFISCASIRSGQYYRLNSGDTWSKIAKIYSSSVSELKAANPNAKFHVGEWIFIPQKIGFMGSDSVDPTYYVGAGGGLMWPVPGVKRISSHFGPRHGRHHDGIDIPAKRGTEFVAVHSGKVIFSGWMRGYGRVVVLSHGNGLKTVYAHNSKNLVDKGDYVKRGQAIGRIGNSGRSRGSHLHFEVRRDKKSLNPKQYLAFYPR